MRPITPVDVEAHCAKNVCVALGWMLWANSDSGQRVVARLNTTLYRQWAQPAVGNECGVAAVVLHDVAQLLDHSKQVARL